MSNGHNAQSEDCILTQIQDLVESCDNEYYMSALGSPMENKNRARRGLERIKKIVSEFEKFQSETVCPACLRELFLQIEHQKQGINEIKKAWNFNNDDE